MRISSFAENRKRIMLPLSNCYTEISNNFTRVLLQKIKMENKRTIINKHYDVLLKISNHKISF